MALKLTIYDIVKGPVVSDKAYKLNRNLNQLMIEVDVRANKAMVKDALEKIFDVKISRIRTAIRKDGTARVMSKRYNARPTISKRKIAYVSLAEGYTLNMFEQTGAPTVGTETTKSA
jgi:ribosomal protein L23